MTPTKLRAFLAVVEHGTFRAAADVLNHTQSSVSQQVAGLEREVGGRLLDRPSGPVRPSLTPLGRIVLDEGRAVLARIDSAQRAVDDFHHGRGHLRIGTFQAVTTTLLPQLVAGLLAEEPTRTIELVETESSAPDLDQVDLCFFDAPPAPGDHGVKVFSDHHVLLSPSDRFPPGAIGLAQLTGIAMVALPRVCDQAVVEDALRARGVEPRIVFRTADNSALAAMVRAGLGSAIMPQLSTTPAEGIDVHQLRPQLPRRTVYVQWRTTPSPLARRAIELAERCARQLRRTETG